MSRIIWTMVIGLAIVIMVVESGRTGWAFILGMAFCTYLLIITSLALVEDWEDE